MVSSTSKSRRRAGHRPAGRPVQAARAGKAGVPTRDPIDANAVVRGGECTPGHRGSGLGHALTIGIGWRDVASTALASVRFTRGNDPPSVGRELRKDSADAQFEGSREP